MIAGSVTNVPSRAASVFFEPLPEYRRDFLGEGVCQSRPPLAHRHLPKWWAPGPPTQLGAGEDWLTRVDWNLNQLRVAIVLVWEGSPAYDGRERLRRQAIHRNRDLNWSFKDDVCTWFNVGGAVGVEEAGTMHVPFGLPKALSWAWADAIHAELRGLGNALIFLPAEVRGPPEFGAPR